MKVLQTKLQIPIVRENTILRPKLYERLNIGLNRKLILISAPAGFGKTTLAGDWINKHQIVTAWFSLDAGDNDPVKFLNYLISAIQNIRKDFGESALELLMSPNKPSTESIASLLINEMFYIKRNFILVLDNFHFINSSEVLELVLFLLQHLPNNVHLVIITRSDPALPVARLRSQHQLVELRLSELSFSQNDISILFNKKLKLGLSIEDINILKTKTEGWIGGLQLVALSLQGRDDVSGFIKNLKGDNQYIMDYLMEEVLKNQTDEVKDFLVQTSILEQISVPLCNSILNGNNSQHIIEKLSKNNSFLIPLDTERNWYRYHYLFADLLKKHLWLKNKNTIIELHNRASDWFMNNSMPLLAIEHAIKGENFDKSMQFLGEEIENMWKNGQHFAILKYGKTLPNNIIRKNADFCFYYAWVLLTTGKIQKAEPFLSIAEEITNQKIEEGNLPKDIIQNHKKLLGKIAIAFTYLNSFGLHAQKTFEYCKLAMKNLTEDDLLWFSWGWYSIGITQFANGNVKECYTAYEKALEYGRKSGNIYLISTIVINLVYLDSRMGLYTLAYKKCKDLLVFMEEKGYLQITKSDSTYTGLYSSMAGIESMQTKFDSALDNIKIAYELSKTELNITYKAITLEVYYLVLIGRGDINGALKKFKELESIIKEKSIQPAAMSIFIAAKGSLLVGQNQLKEANNFFKEYGIGLNNEISYKNENGYVAYAQLLIAELRLKEAESLLSKLYHIAQSANRIERIVELKVLFAILYKAKGDDDKAVLKLIESMEYAVNDSILLYYILSLDKINDLLNTIFKMHASGKTKIPKQFISKLKSATKKRLDRINIKAKSGLSAREIDTLKLIADHLSNPEIAEKLFISLNTVKTHLKNIFLKLDVDSRSKAIAKAKEIGLL